MNRVTHDLLSGSDAWHKFRLTKFGASEAAAMLGLSATMTRTELLRMKHTGLAREFSDWLQAHVLDRGHKVEALARPHAEAFVGDDLFPVTRSMGRLSASCDGLTLDDSIAWEHKQWSESLSDRMTVGIMPAEHMPQCQQVLLVTGAHQLLFTVSDGTPDRMLHLWVEPDPVWFQRLQQGWDRFEVDLAAYVLPESAQAAPVGQAPDSLPALRIEVTGEVTASNLAEFKQTALAAIRSVNRDLKTDADFADAEKAVKWCSDVESRLKAAKEHALSQTASIDALFKTIDDIGAEAKRVRLDLDKLVTRRKDEVKASAVSAARKALDDHVAVLQAELAPMRLQPVAADFATAIKGLRSIASMQDALDTVLANGKIHADAQARVIRGNVATFQQQAAGLEFLFADLGSVIHKAADDFAALVSSRIATHRAAEAERERRRAEAEQQRIAAEAARLAAEQVRQAEEAARAAEQQALAEQQAARQAAEARMSIAYDAARRRAGDDEAYEAYLAFSGGHGEKVPLDKVDDYIAALNRLPAPAAAPAMPAVGHVPPRPMLPPAPPLAALVAAVPAPAPRADEPATLNLGAICGRLGFTVSAQFLADVLHVQPARTDKASKLYTERQFAVICSQLVSHVGAMAELYAGEPA